MIKYKFIHLVIVHAYMLFEFDSPPILVGVVLLDL